ncbi:hypothetical protein KEM48_004272 [Puccinia striiformis f. sp. tritici PST-130]|nr:hypothetical protein KEM48_004272 [Puccinia striiformis f. sp. tritici PST-130]
MSVHESIGKDTMKKLVNVPKVFMPLLGHISSFAIKQCKAQFDRLKGDFDPTEPCSQTLMKGVGIPCAHRLAELLETDDGLTSADFHLQWHLKYNPESTASPIKGDQAEDGSTYGEEVDSAALLALLDEKMAVPDLILQVPRHLQSMVKDVFHPHGDGHCGFQCVSRALGYDNDGSDGFLRVRQEMIAEIEGNRPTYLKLQGGEEEVSKIIKGLTMQPSETIVPPEKWLDKMSHGQIVANAYSRPIESADPGPLYLLHVNGNHWALPHVEGSVKPLAPPILATRSTTKAAKGWLAYIEQGVASYNTSSHKCHFTSR